MAELHHHLLLLSTHAWTCLTALLLLLLSTHAQTFLTAQHQLLCLLCLTMLLLMLLLRNAEASTADADMLSRLTQGYSIDSWFASARNTAALDTYQGLYYQGDALVIPNIPELKRSIMQELHGANYSGHVGYHRTIHNVNRMYWWPGMAAEIEAYVQGCKTCQEDKSLQTHPSGNLVSTPIPKQPWDNVTMDRIVSLPKTKRGSHCYFSSCRQAYQNGSLCPVHK